MSSSKCAAAQGPGRQRSGIAGGGSRRRSTRAPERPAFVHIIWREAERSLAPRAHASPHSRHRVRSVDDLLSEMRQGHSRAKDSELPGISQEMSGIPECGRTSSRNGGRFQIGTRPASCRNTWPECIGICTIRSWHQSASALLVICASRFQLLQPRRYIARHLPAG